MFQARTCSDATKAALAGCFPLIAAAILFLAGCAQPLPRQETSPKGDALAPPSKLAPTSAASHAGTPAQESGSALPAQELTDSVLYEFLLAEIAAQRGNVGLAAQAYGDLAKRTRDPRIARRATEIAVFAHMANVAIDSAKVWHETEPDSQRPLQTLSSLLVSAGRFDKRCPTPGSC